MYWECNICWLLLFQEKPFTLNSTNVLRRFFIELIKSTKAFLKSSMSIPLPYTVNWKTSWLCLATRDAAQQAWTWATVLQQVTTACLTLHLQSRAHLSAIKCLASRYSLCNIFTGSLEFKNWALRCEENLFSWCPLMTFSRTFYLLTPDDWK